MRNQGDGWSFALDYLDRVLGQLEMVPISIEVDVEDLHAMFRGLSQTLGTRIGELHQAFALPVEDPAFQPEPVTESDVLDLEGVDWPAGGPGARGASAGFRDGYAFSGRTL